MFDVVQQKEVAKARLGQIPMTDELYLKETLWYPECRQMPESYEKDIHLAMQAFGKLLAPVDDANYDLRVY